MRKIYQKPQIEIFTNGFNLMESTGVASLTTGNAKITSGEVKGQSSYDEDEDAYSSSYGDLW